MNNRINKVDISNQIADKFQLQKKVSVSIVETVFDIISDSLANDDYVEISRFGKFDITHRKSRIGTNPNTHEHIVLESTNTPSFKASKLLKDKINRK